MLHYVWMTKSKKKNLHVLFFIKNFNANKRTMWLGYTTPYLCTCYYVCSYGWILTWEIQICNNKLLMRAYVQDGLLYTCKFLYTQDKTSTSGLPVFIVLNMLTNVKKKCFVCTELFTMFLILVYWNGEYMIWCWQ